MCGRVGTNRQDFRIHNLTRFHVLSGVMTEAAEGSQPRGVAGVAMLRYGTDTRLLFSSILTTRRF
jgi:hypothetical protein